MIHGYRRTLLLTSIALILVLDGRSARASCTEYWVTTSVPLYQMAKSNWCWAAVSLMILRDFRPSYQGSQSSLVRQVTGSTDNVSGNPDWILDNPQLSDIAHDWEDGPISFETLQDNIYWNLPVQLDLDNGKGGKHAVVVYGYHAIDCTYNGVVEFIIWDPVGYSYRMTYDDLVSSPWSGTRYNFRLR